MTRTEKAKQIAILLKKEFPHPKIALNHKNGLELLVATILSAQCTDIRVNQTTPELFKKYPTAKAYANADPKQLANDIKSINLRNNKAKNIVAMAKLLIQNYGGEVPNNLEDLTTLPGVGRKTANVVLGHWFKIPSGFVVDTHVKRGAYRMGLTNSKDVLVIEQDLMKLFPKQEWTSMASRIIFHGRTTCPASRKPDQACSLGDLCKVRE